MIKKILTLLALRFSISFKNHANAVSLMSTSFLVKVSTVGRKKYINFK